VVRTRVGYAGGQKRNPTYHDLGDHTESLQIDYDPQQISYEHLLDIFWKTHNPCASSYSRQYMSAVFYHNEQQREIAERTRDREAAAHSKRIATQLLPLTAFYRAEDYHQKYTLRRKADLLREFEAMYPDPQAFTDSTAAARVNGALGGNARLAELEKEIDRYGLSSEACEMVRKRAK
jgi:peptide-methionine (S)-S-oxide reductase